MLVLEAARRVWSDLGSLPLMSRIGLALMPIAFVADVVINLSPAGHHHAGFAPQNHMAHLLGLLAMVLVIAGVVIDGARRHRSRRRTSHAHR